ncbi:MAG: citramalate synthase [Trueperaceae bacterium]
MSDGPLRIYDTTLRDGAQAEGVNFTSEDKVAIARRLDAFGMDLIEGGWPGSNPKDIEFFERMRDVPLLQARLAAFGSTCRRGVEAEDDENLQALLAVGTPVVTVFGKAWTLHVSEALGAGLDENLSMIRRSVELLKTHGREVIYDAEHFFDGYAADSAYALATLSAALEGGADTLVLCDTNGGTLPGTVERLVREARELFPLPIGIHAHNDSELAVANTLAAVDAGVGHVQGTVNGYGERCGNANLISVLPNLALKLNRPQPQAMTALRELSRFVDERANLPPNVRAPFVGDAAFAHKGGVHVSAVNKRPDTYEHIDPEAVGNRRRILLSELSGRANVLAKSVEFGESIGAMDPSTREVVARLKELEHRGYSFEGAEASFQLLSRKVRGDYRPYFTLHGFSVLMDKREGESEPSCQAVIKVEVGGVLEHTASVGHGPVNALDRALTKALSRFYPSVGELRLVDYKVRVLDGTQTGTAAVVRVQLEITDGHDSWGTVGASSDIIDASYEALLDAIEYKLLKDGTAPREGVAPADRIADGIA